MRRLQNQGGGNETRGMILGGFDGSNATNNTEFITISGAMERIQ